MSVLVFDRMARLSAGWAVPAALAWLVLALAMAGALNEAFTLDLLLAPWSGRFWGAAAAACCGLFAWTLFWPLMPAKVFGVVYWPVHLAGAALRGHLADMTLMGAAAFVIAGAMAGRFEAWAPRPADRRALALAGWGAAAGAVCGVAGAASARAVFVADALARLGFRLTGGFLLWLSVPALAATAAAAVWLGARGGGWGTRWRAGALAALAAAWTLPVGLSEAALRAGWDFGRAGLAEAAGIPRADEAATDVVVVLSRRDGSPGTQRRELLLAVGGLAVSPAGLAAVRRYLDAHRWRTVFLGEALAYLRAGWALLWEPARQMDADLVRLGPRFPPDFDAFLASIRVAPATPEDYGRLENLARAADKASAPSVRAAGRRYQGISDAYARFGDLESSNLWLDRIRKLMPLYDDPIDVDPIEDRHDGVVAGSVLFDGRPASEVRVGLFMSLSTAAAASGETGLVASAWPDADGRFEFKDLTPGRYYLAVRAPPLLFAARALEFWNAPGVVTLRAGAMQPALLPVEIVRPAAAPSRVPPARAALPGMSPFRAPAKLPGT